MNYLVNQSIILLGWTSKYVAVPMFIHLFVSLVIGASNLRLCNVDEYINWLNNIVSACLPDLKVDFTFYELVKTYQI